jgi:hypothetical protein
MGPVGFADTNSIMTLRPAPMVLRTTAQVEQLFEGVDLIEPGLTDVNQWRHDQKPLPIRILSGVGKVHQLGR